MAQLTHERVQRVAKQANDTGVAITGGLARLMQGIEGVQGQFKGKAGTALQVASGELDGELKRILEALNTIASALDSTSAKFGATDDAAQAEITKVARSEGGDVYKMLH